MEEGKIDQLINARTSANNHLAIELMQNLLNYTFEEAFLRLKLTPMSGKDNFCIEITRIRIEYRVDFQEMLYVPAKFADINRRIYYDNKLEPNSAIKIHADEQSVFALGWECKAEHLQEIRADLKHICPHIEALYELMGEGY